MWRKDDPVLSKEGDLDKHGNLMQVGSVVKGGMWAHQRSAWDSHAFIIALVMGYGGGKTFLQGKFSIAMARHNPRSPYMVVSPSYKIAKRTIIPTIEELLEGRKLRYRFNKSDHEFKIAGGGTIWIGSGDEPKSLKGPNLCGAGIDEPFIQEIAVFEQMLARVRCPKARVRKIFMTGTPEDLNWGYDICKGDDKHKYDLELIQASTRCNLALPADYVKTLESGYDEKMADAYVDGKFVNMSTGRIYYGFNRERNVKSLPFPANTPSELGQDFNVDPMASCLFWTKGDHMHIYKEMEYVNSNTEQAIDNAVAHADKAGGKLTTCYPDPSGKSRKTSAPAGQTDFTIIKEAGVRVKARAKAPRIRDRRNAFNKKLADGTLTVAPECKRMIKYLEQLSHEKLKQQDEMTHLTDAAGYPVEYKFPIRKPIIQEAGGRDGRHS